MEIFYRCLIDSGFISWRLAMLVVNLVCQFGAQQWLSSGPYSDPDIAIIRGFDNFPETVKQKNVPETSFPD